MTDHPALRFKAPRSLQAGVPLKDVLGRPLVRLIAESLEQAVPRFNAGVFEKTALKGLDALEFSGRAAHIGRAMGEQLPAAFDAAAPLLVKSFGPERAETERLGLSVFFYMPHGALIAEAGTGHFDAGMMACYELTKRMTAEFAVRPFIIRHRAKALKLLMKWASDPNTHVRRLVSEGTRPRLPWAMRLPEIQANPELSIPLLEKLKDDDELYVRRSVANHLGDILKDHPQRGFEVAEAWLATIPRDRLPPDAAKARKWIIRHAVRLPAKKGDKRATSLRIRAK